MAVREIDAQSADLNGVLALWRAERQWLGFLPTAGFTSRAAQGLLLGAWVDGTLRGYALFDVPHNHVKIIHLCVAQPNRGRGIAAALVRAVSERFPDRRGVVVACRRDFPADGLWQRLGFTPLAERIGRSEARLPLTVWLLDHGQPELWSDVGSGRDLACLDQMVVADLALQRPQGVHSLKLRDAWISEEVELCVTDEVFHETNRCEEPRERAAMRECAGGFRRLTSDSSWAELVPRIASHAPQAGPADHQHVARAVRAGASYFVTRDGNLLRGSKPILDSFGIRVLRPEALIEALDAARSTNSYQPSALMGTPIAATDIRGVPDGVLASEFQNYGSGERKQAFLQTLRDARASPQSHVARLYRAKASGSAAEALVVVEERDDALIVRLLRVRGAGRRSAAIARQLVREQRRLAAERRVGSVIVADATPTRLCLGALAAEGFERTSDGWLCRVETGLRRVCDGTARDAALLERSRWPVRTIGAGLNTYIIPIQQAWAEQLFDTQLAQRTLFDRPTDLGLSCEHVYYRKPRNSGGIGRDARILWYVSGAGPGQTEGHVRAVSTVAEVATGAAGQLYRRFSRLGVYDRPAVMSTADDDGKVMAIRFVDTEQFSFPVSLSVLRQFSTGFSAPMSPRRVSEDFFASVYRAASGYVGR